MKLWTKRLLATMLVMALLVACGISGLVLPVSAETAEPVDLLNGYGSFDANSYSGTPLSDIAKTSVNNAVVTDPTDPNNKVLQLGMGKDANGDGEIDANSYSYDARYLKAQSTLYNPATGKFNAKMQEGKAYTLTFRVYGDGVGFYYSPSYIGIISLPRETSGSGWYKMGGVKDSEGNYQWKTYSIIFYGIEGSTAAKSNWASYSITLKKDGSNSHVPKAGPTYIDDIRLYETPATELALTAEKGKMDIGTTQTITAAPVPKYSAYDSVVWSSSDETVATVDSETGLVTALAEGTVTITATSGTIVETVDITVVDPTKVFSEMFEGTVSSTISKWSAKGTVTEDPLDSTNKVLKLGSAVSAEYSGGAFNLAKNKMYELSVRFYGEEGTSARFGFNGSKGVMNPTTHAISMDGTWKTARYILKMADSVVNDGWVISLTASAGVCLDDITITEIPYDDNMIIGGDFEMENHHEHTSWNHVLTSGYCNLEAEEGNADNTVLHIKPVNNISRDEAWFYKNLLNLKSNTAYELTMRVKGGAAYILFHGGKKSEYNVGWNRVFAGGDEWQTVTIPFTTNTNAESVGFELAFGCPGTEDVYVDTYIDDVMLFPTDNMVARKNANTTNGSIYIATQTMKKAKQLGAGGKAGEIVTVTVTPNSGYMMVPGSLTYTGVTSKTEVKILNESLTDNGFGGTKGNTYQFKMPNESVTVTAQFVSTAEQTFAMDTLGTSLRKKADGSFDGIRFLTRMNLATTFDEGTETLSVLYGGAEYEIVEFGSLLKRYEEGVELTDENDVWKAVAYTKGEAMKLVDYTESYIDFTSVMLTTYTDRTYTARGYLVLRPAEGEDVVLYSANQLSDSIASAQARL